MKTTTPKTRLGALKVPMHLVPPSAKIELAKALEDGGKKYGPYNWRDEPISMSVYYAAIQRHIDAWWDGEELAKDSGVHHLAHAMACCALLIDSSCQGKLIDDRPPIGAAASLLSIYNAQAGGKRDDT
jgi:hypothetical protein